MPKLTWVLMAVLALAACKSGTTASGPSPSTSPSATTISKADFITRANAICTTMNTKGNALPNPQDQANLKAAIDQAIPITSDGLAQLRALPMPTGDETTLQAYYTKVDQLVTDLRQESAAVQANDITKGQQILTNLQNDLTAADDAATAYGLTACAQA
ncbi:MAG TPA: hypothetical protein VET24_11535 [Actinomycetota bacterium]|nr:hypothetical protein [Actinomycetota bacterium]